MVFQEFMFSDTKFPKHTKYFDVSSNLSWFNCTWPYFAHFVLFFLFLLFFCFYYYLSSVHYYEDRFHIHVINRSSNIWLSYIHNRLFTTSRVYLETTQWPALSWLISSVGRELHRYRGGHGFKFRTGLNFFQAFFSLLLK